MLHGMTHYCMIVLCATATVEIRLSIRSPKHGAPSCAALPLLVSEEHAVPSSTEEEEEQEEGEGCVRAGCIHILVVDIQSHHVLHSLISHHYLIAT